MRGGVPLGHRQAQVDGRDGVAQRLQGVGDGEAHAATLPCPQARGTSRSYAAAVIRTRLLVLAVPALLAVAGCSDDGLDVEGLSPGACTDVAPALEDVDEALREVEDEDTRPGEAAKRFADAQAVLSEAEGDAEGEVGPALVDLRRQLGLYRISVDSNEYDGSQAEPVEKALQAVLDACR